jgi:bifunctional non-homologous end joining protein LigD
MIVVERTGELTTYRRKRDASRTPEPVPEEGPVPRGRDDTFVVQEHHARRLHWDFRLERGGVLVSWAVPKGLPVDPHENHLAVRTEDHPLEYAAFEGEIPHGEYGGGTVTIWDAGTYELVKWTEDEVEVVLHGRRTEGRYVLFRTRGKDWQVHRMDPPPADWTPMPSLVPPMLATPGTLPPAHEDAQWAYEMKWDGVRTVAYVDGGRVRLLSRNDRDVTATYPELRGLGDQLGSVPAVLDGEVVALDATGRPDFALLQRRMGVTKAAQVRRLADEVPVVYLVFDVLYLDGRDTTGLPYRDRRELLEGLGLEGPSWAVPPTSYGGGTEMVEASRERGLEGVLAKRADSPYLPGRRSPHWRKVKNIRTQEVVVAGWRPGTGRREGTIGSLLLGLPSEEGLVYVGHVGTGFTAAALADAERRLHPLERKTSPFAVGPPRADARDAHWVTPKLVGEVAFTEWTGEGRLRHPSWRGFRLDKSPDEVVRESS